MSYAVPRALHSAGLLGRLVTDLHFDSPSKIRRLQRYSSGLPPALVSRDNAAGLSYRAALSTASRSYWPHLRIAEAMADRTVQEVEEAGAELVYGFDTAMLPVMDRLRDAGVVIVLEQCIAPRAQFIAAMEKMRASIEGSGLDFDLGDLEREIAVARMFGAIERSEWGFADRIYCPSDFVASSLHDLGVEAPKTRVVPYGVTVPEGFAGPGGKDGAKPRIVFCGRFSWRKGALEFGQAANALKADAHFEVLGQVGLPEGVVSAIAPDVELRGHLSRDEFLRSLGSADIMVLPSYSEGSATVVYEAMAMGVPCVVSHATGSVITEGEDGLIVDAGEPDELVSAIADLLGDPARRAVLAKRARETARSYTQESYGKRVVEALQEDYCAVRDEKAGR